MQQTGDGEWRVPGAVKTGIFRIRHTLTSFPEQKFSGIFLAPLTSSLLWRCLGHMMMLRSRAISLVSVIFDVYGGGAIIRLVCHCELAVSGFYFRLKWLKDNLFQENKGKISLPVNQNIYLRSDASGVKAFQYNMTTI